MCQNGICSSTHHILFNCTVCILTSCLTMFVMAQLCVGFGVLKRTLDQRWRRCWLNTPPWREWKSRGSWTSSSTTMSAGSSSPSSSRSSLCSSAASMLWVTKKDVLPPAPAQSKNDWIENAYFVKTQSHMPQSAQETDFTKHRDHIMRTFFLKKSTVIIFIQFSRMNNRT